MQKVLEQVFEQGLFEVYDDRPGDLDLLEVKQTHSSIILKNKQDFDPHQEADGMILALSELKNQALAIKTADCLPILYLSSTHVAIVHAGWRGLANKIYLNRDLINMKPHTIYIGPSIQAESFEVGKDFKEHFPQSSCFIEKNDQLYFNLQEEARQQLIKFFPDVKMTISGICTFENKAYNSYRKNKTKKRNWNIFRLNLNKEVLNEFTKIDNS